MTIDNMGGQEQSSWKLPVSKVDNPYGENNYGHYIEASRRYTAEIEKIRETGKSEELIDKQNDEVGMELVKAIGSGELESADSQFAWNFIDKYGKNETNDFLLKGLLTPEDSKAFFAVKHEDKLKAWDVLKNKTENKADLSAKVAERVGKGLIQSFPPEDTRDILSYIKENGNDMAAAGLAEGILDNWAGEFKNELWEILELKGGSDTASVLARELSDKKFFKSDENSKKILDYISKKGDGKAANHLIRELRKPGSESPFDYSSRKDIWKIVTLIGDKTTAEELPIVFAKYNTTRGVYNVKPLDYDEAKFIAAKINMRLAWKK